MKAPTIDMIPTRQCLLVGTTPEAMKLGDAIIAATAVAYGIPLLTRNEDDFKHIPGLDLRTPFAFVP